MLSQRGVSTICSNRKRKFGTVDGVLGDLHPANPCEEEEFGSSSSDSCRLASSTLRLHVSSNLAKSVVSLAPFDEGGTMHPVCTGIVFDHSKSRTYVLTSLRQFRSSDDDDGENRYKRKTKVWLPNNQVVKGILMFHDLKHNLGVVNVLQKEKGGCLHASCLDHPQQPESCNQVVVVRRCYSSGKLEVTTGTVAGDPMGGYCCEEAPAGQLLVDFLGNIVGLSYCAEEGSAFIPRSTMLEFIAGFRKVCAEKKAKSADLRRRLVAQQEFLVENYKWKGTTVKLKTLSPSHMSCLEGSSRMQEKQSACHYCDPEGLSAPGHRFERLFPGRSWPTHGDAVSKEAARDKIRSKGYPLPVLADSGMRLLCGFEKEFDEDIWSKLSEKVASDMYQSVVALASFSGDKRFFACTGIFIGCNELTTTVLTSASLVRNSDDEADNLKIEVCLPDNEHATGMLQHYNLHYNIAIITIKDYRCTRIVQIFDQLQTEPCGEVAAVGRVYESGKLIATGGTLIDKPSEFDCKELKMSTCKITKAGIGGPLIDCYGNFIGMDFYSSEETPYLPSNLVLEVLRSFDAMYAIFYINVDFCVACECFIAFGSLQPDGCICLHKTLCHPFSVPN
uniref:Uncharacterized protein n=1 Tax=Avena sativa TaxID=4498 RepID=A0ACD5ZXI7_AVESA